MKRAIRGLAQSVMEAYQRGVPITKVLEISKNDLMRAMVLEAYDSNALHA